MTVLEGLRGWLAQVLEPRPLCYLLQYIGDDLIPPGLGRAWLCKSGRDTWSFGLECEASTFASPAEAREYIGGSAARLDLWQLHITRRPRAMTRSVQW